MKYVALDIGCLECGETSCVLGIFDNPSDAKAVIDECYKIQEDNWHGEHYFTVRAIAHENMLSFIPYYADDSNLIVRMNELGIAVEEGCSKGYQR